MNVSSAGNVKLRPELLAQHQAYTKNQLKSKLDSPVFLVFHGGSGSTKEEITTAVKSGVVKMNIDTGSPFFLLCFFIFSYSWNVDNFKDTQWGYMLGFRVRDSSLSSFAAG